MVAVHAFSHQSVAEERIGNPNVRLDPVRRKAVQILRRTDMSNWMELKSILCNGFNDSWYPVDIETTITDQLVDDIIAVRIAYMTGYEIKYEQVLHQAPQACFARACKYDGTFA